MPSKIACPVAKCCRRAKAKAAAKEEDYVIRLPIKWQNQTQTPKSISRSHSIDLNNRGSWPRTASPTIGHLSIPTTNNLPHVSDVHFLQMELPALLQQLEPEIADADEETFLLFSQSSQSQDLGFVDPKSETIDLSIGNLCFSLSQSPGLLSSNRNDGTTGAVLWRVTPLFAEWLSSNKNILFESKILHGKSTVIELGCGSSGILALTLGPMVGKFIATDQEYVFKLLRSNLQANVRLKHSQQSHAGKADRGGAKAEPRSNSNNVHVLALDWEKSSAASLPYILQGEDGVDMVIACDCIYNDALIAPLVDTCADICRLRGADARPTVCVIAQQLRSDSVFTAWLTAFSEVFRVWRVPDEVCGADLSSRKGFAVHLGVLKTSPVDLRKEE